MTKCNNFTSIVNDTIEKPLSAKTQTLPDSKKPAVVKQKKKPKTNHPNTSGNRSTLFRFVPVDSIKHAPSICLSSLETAACNPDFSLEFCARERSLPYFKMIHSRLLLGAIDANLQSIDLKAVFLLAEATIWFLKNIVSQLASRSEFKKRIRCESAYENYKINQAKQGIVLNESRKKAFISEDEFAFTPSVFKKTKPTTNLNNVVEQEEKEILNSLSDNVNNPTIVPVNKLPTNLFDLKNLLQVFILFASLFILCININIHIKIR